MGYFLCHRVCPTGLSRIWKYCCAGLIPGCVGSAIQSVPSSVSDPVSVRLCAAIRRLYDRNIYRRRPMRCGRRAGPPMVVGGGGRRFGKVRAWTWREVIQRWTDAGQDIMRAIMHQTHRSPVTPPHNTRDSGPCHTSHKQATKTHRRRHFSLKTR